MKAIHAVLRGTVPPNDTQRNRIVAHLEERYGGKVELVFEADETVIDGFRIEILSEVIDFSLQSRFGQLKQALTELSHRSENIAPLLGDTVRGWMPGSVAHEIGKVLTVGDGIATVSGLAHAAYGEILLFDGGIRGMALDLKRSEIGCILFGDDRGILEGSTVRRAGSAAGIPVGRAFLGRVIDALGNPIDGKGAIKAADFMPVEAEAPGIIDRRPVNRPMETGILAIDSMFPIGKGQRELIIGDRQTGKTAIALDTILNQKGKDVICIYVAIGQKTSSVAHLTEVLRKTDALPYTVVINASASDSAPLQYIAPYAGCTLAEYFMHLGKDVLIVYDDLSKHAIAYRALSLLLERSPGREAYPGDVFYLHARLLERAAQLSEARGGGSITALPIVETQGGNVSAYIPTNIISITDGQIFLESELFFAGQRPAINVGLSVSRVGGAAQTKAVRTASGALRLDLAQYREIEIFTQFASDLDDATKRQLRYGQGLMQLLKQEQYSPMRRHEQVITLLAALNRVMQDIPQKRITEVCRGIVSHVQTRAPYICQEIERGELTQDMQRDILELCHAYCAAKI